MCKEYTTLYKKFRKEPVLVSFISLSERAYEEKRLILPPVLKISVYEQVDQCQGCHAAVTEACDRENCLPPGPGAKEEEKEVPVFPIRLTLSDLRTSISSLPIKLPHLPVVLPEEPNL